MTWAAGKVEAAGQMDGRALARASCRTRMAATTSPMSSWRSTARPSSSALKVSTIANMGAYLSTFATCIPTYLYGTLLAGTYTTPAIYVETKAVFTHTVPVDAYRGAGRPEATFLLERIVDLAADELGMDPAELRRRNFIPKDAYPLSDAGRAAIRQRRLRHDPRARAEGGRLPGLRAAAPRGGGARQAARHRRRHLYRGLRHRALGGGRLARRPRRPLRMRRRSASTRPAASRS